MASLLLALLALSASASAARAPKSAPAAAAPPPAVAARHTLASFDWASRYNPVADPAVVRLAGASIRVSVLKASVVRLEYAADGVFDDSSTVAVLNRRFAAPAFTWESEGSVSVLETASLRVRIDADPALGPGLTAANVQMELKVAPFSAFSPGSPASGNMHGTFRTLDRVGDPINLACPPVTSFYVYYCHCEEGLASRDGWVIVDDTLRPRLDLDADGSGIPWPRAPVAAALRGDGSYADLYVFASGHNYTASLGDFKDLSGAIPLSPRFALGPAFSRWFQWNDVENLAIVQAGFADNGIPLDLLVVDMDWHYTYPRGLQNPHSVQVEGWTGHTVYPYLFPESAHFARYLAKRGVRLMFNHHHAAGVQFHEAVYPSFARAVGVNPASGQTIEFDIANRTWTDIYFREVIKPLEDVGVNLDWQDFQQQPVTKVPLLNPTITINHAWYTNPHRYGSGAPAARARDRPFIMGRFGGLGAHRYPIGFVGDTYVKWDVLRYETYFMPTSSNVLFQWTHDIGGFEGPSPAEFFARHVQFGTFSPSLRTHSSKRSPARAIWTYQQPYFAIMKRFYRLRARLVPYIASMQRVAHDTGVQVVRPLYYAYPEAPAAYADQGLHQYAFGESMWFAPIAAPAPPGQNASTLAKLLASAAGDAAVPRTYFNVSGAAVTPWTFWAPPGRWLEWFSWEAFTSPAPHGAFFTRNYAIGELPLFSAPGTIVPLRTLPANGGGVLGISSTVPRALTLLVFGGVEVPRGESRTTRGRWYDDDGVSVGYEHGEFSWTEMACEWRRAVAGAPAPAAGAAADAGADGVTCTIAPPVGDGFAGMPAARSYTLRFLASLPPAAVAIDGVAVAHDALGTPDAHGDNDAWDAGAPAWSYDGGSLSTWLHVGPPRAVAAPLTIELTWARGVAAADALATSGFARKAARATACKEEIDALYGMLFTSDVESLLNVTAAATRMSVASAAPAVLAQLGAVPGYLAAALREMRAWRIPAAHRAKAAQLRCINAVQDALAGLSTPLPDSDARVVDAMKAPSYTYTPGEHLQVPDPTLEMPATDF